MSYLLLGLAVLGALLVLLRWFVSSSPAQVMWALRWAGIIFSGLLTVFFFVTARLAFALPAFIVFLLLVTRGLGLGGSGRGRAAPGSRSSVQTEYLDMTLDHSTGQMDGRVLKGPFEGRHLSQLRIEDLVALLQDCSAQDEQSARVMESYLDRQHPEWREFAQGSRGGPMTVDEARRILGVGPNASEGEIRAAHRGLMRKHHPDQGGSPEFAARINEARDLLLGG